MDYAKWLGLDLEAEKDLLWIAREGLKAPLPEHWKPCKTPGTGDIYYFNFQTGDSVWEHPCDEYYKSLYAKEKANLEERRRKEKTAAARNPPDEDASAALPAPSAANPTPNPLNKPALRLGSLTGLAPLGTAPSTTPAAARSALDRPGASVGLRPGAAGALAPPEGGGPSTGPSAANDDWRDEETEKDAKRREAFAAELAKAREAWEREMSLEADAAKARASRATEALARETEDTLLELKREHATRADALRAQLAEAEARLSEARREAEEAEASARAKAEAAEANAREDAESTKKALEAKLRAADADVAEARAAAEKAAADARAEAEFASRKKIAALEARAAEAEAKAAAAEAKAAKALASSDPEAAARSADAAAARRHDADEFAAADEFADDDSVSGFESIADPDESEAPSASVGSGASSSSSDVSAAVRRSDASATLACVFSFLKDARRSLRERRVCLDRLRREWFLGARALRDVPDASLREGKRAAVSAVRAALDAQAAHFTADARNLRAALVAARSVRDGGAAWEAAFSASVMGERPESVRRTFAEGRLEGGYPGAAPTKVEDTHEARARRAITSKRYEQFGEDPLKLLARSTRALQDLERSRVQVSGVARHVGGPRAHRTFDGGNTDVPHGSLSEGFLRAVDGWNRVADRERALFEGHGEWLRRFREEIDGAGAKAARSKREAARKSGGETDALKFKTTSAEFAEGKKGKENDYAFEDEFTPKPSTAFAYRGGRG